MAVTLLLKNHEPVQLSLSHRGHHRLVPDSCDHHHLDAPHLDHNRRFVECPDHDLAYRPGHQREPTTRITTTALTAKKNDDNRVNRPRNQRKTATRTTCTALTAERYPPAKEEVRPCDARPPRIRRSLSQRPLTESRDHHYGA